MAYKTGALTVVDSEEVTYAPGVIPLNSAEKVICTRYSNGSIVISGAISILSSWAGGVFFTIPERFRAQYNISQKWVNFNSTDGKSYTGLMGMGGNLSYWGSYSVSDIQNRTLAIYISY